jgi:hypothetical protein
MRSRDVFSWAIGFGVLATSVLAGGSDQDSPPTWAKDVAPLVFANCTPCHSPGGHSPFPLVKYDDVRRRAELVRQVVLNLQMPPCAFTSDFAMLCQVRPLTDEERVMLQKWIRAGLPEGTGAPQAPTFEHAFRLGKPDIVLRPPVLPKVPTEGNPVWRAVLIDPKLETEVCIRGFDIKPAEPQSVRHVLLAVASDKAWMNVWPTNGTLDENASRFIGAWAPGYKPFQLPEGVSLVLRPGEKLVAQVLYQTIGRPVDTSIEIGLTLSRGASDREAYWVTKEVKDFTLPTFDETLIKTTVEIERERDLFAIVPEARFYAYVIEIDALFPDGAQKSLLRTLRWSPYWSGSFVFSPGVRLPAGSRIESNTVFENEPHSPINEGMRPRTVYSGPGLDQEVCRTHYLFADR